MKSILVLAFAALSLCSPTPSDPNTVSEDHQDTKRAGTESLTEGYWSCTVPSNAIYNKVRQQNNVCKKSGFSMQYFIKLPKENEYSCSKTLPKDGNYGCDVGRSARQYKMRQATKDLLACSIPDGFTYVSVTDVADICEIGRSTKQYKLRRPSDDLLACTLPKGYTYTQLLDVSICDVGRRGKQYKLKLPTQGLVACSIPDGWASSKETQVLNTCRPGSVSSQYTLKKKK
nr:uncharacterized protein CTRU02_12117 [Colletotrichum truncatum]KAF6784906.1 hypothetical protein CTRU02_12117 [Colletotrichum truncatum]